VEGEKVGRRRRRGELKVNFPADESNEIAESKSWPGEKDTNRKIGRRELPTMSLAGGGKN